MGKIIAKISEGLGNQLFMYANAYSLSKKINYDLILDTKTGYNKLKIRNFMLDNFNIDIKYAHKSQLQNNIIDKVYYKFNKKIDHLRNKKKFLIEKKYSNKSTFFEDYSKLSFSDTVFVEGYFESEKYFAEYKNDIVKQFKISKINYKTLFIDPSIIKGGNSISIAIRQHRFSEKLKNSKSIYKSDQFVKNTISYILKACEFIKSKIPNPKFYVFSNDISNLDNYFNQDNFIIVKHFANKAINDFYLSTLCKHFIVGPTTFHWWSAYLSDFQEKICIKPPNEIKFSSNKDIYPSSWKSLSDLI